MTKQTVYYRKEGRRYVPVALYDQDLCDSYPFGCTLVQVAPGCQTRRYNVDPDRAGLVAAAMYATDSLTDALRAAGRAQPEPEPLTKEQHDAWQHLNRVMETDVKLLYGSLADIARAGAESLATEFEQTLAQHPQVREAYEQFKIVYKLAQ